MDFYEYINLLILPFGVLANGSKRSSKSAMEE